MNEQNSTNYILEIYFPLKFGNYSEWSEKIENIAKKHLPMEGRIKRSGSGNKFYYFNNEDVARSVLNEVIENDLSKGFSLLRVIQEGNDSIINSLKV